MTGVIQECEQYMFAASGRVGRAKRPERLLIFESPLEDNQGTLFMIETPEGEERGAYQSKKYGGEAMRDMRKKVRGVRFTRIDREPTTERAGARLILA